MVATIPSFCAMEQGTVAKRVACRTHNLMLVGSSLTDIIHTVISLGKMWTWLLPHNVDHPEVSRSSTRGEALVTYSTFTSAMAKQPTLALKPRGDVTWIQKMYQWPQNRTYTSAKTIKEKTSCKPNQCWEAQRSVFYLCPVTTQFPVLGLSVWIAYFTRFPFQQDFLFICI